MGYMYMSASKTRPTLAFHLQYIRAIADPQTRHDAFRS